MQGDSKREGYLLLEIEASLIAAILARADEPFTSLLVGNDKCKANVEAPICLSYGKITLGGLLSGFLNIASHHKANSREPRE